MSVKMKQSGIEWIGEIPEHWDLERIKYHLIERVEKNDPIKTDEILSLTAKQGVIPYHMKTDFSGNKPKEDLSAYRLAYPGDIVMNSMNILTGSVGLSKYFGCVSPVYNMLHPIDNSIDSVEYFNLIFQTKEFQRSLRGLGNGILIKETDDGNFNTVRVRIPIDKFKNVFVPIPPIEEQQLIAVQLNQICGTLDNTKSDIEKQIEILNEYKKSVITETVTKGLDKNAKLKYSGIDWIGEIPEHWNIIKGKYLFRQRNSKGNKELILLSPTQNYGVIPQTMYEELSGMKSVKLSEDTNLNLLKTININDFCISLRSFQGGFELSKYNGVVSNAYQVFYAYKELIEDYYKYMFKDKIFIEKMNAYTLSLRDGKNIAFKDFGDTYIPIPPIEEQKEIADYLDSKCSEIDSIIETKKQQLELLEEYKKSIIYEYVTGKREVLAPLGGVSSPLDGVSAKPDFAVAPDNQSVSIE